MSGSLLVWAVLFGSIGFGFFVYGKKERAIVPLLAGIALIVAPYLVSNVILLLLIGCALVAAPYFVRF